MVVAENVDRGRCEKMTEWWREDRARVVPGSLSNKAEHERKL